MTASSPAPPSAPAPPTPKPKSLQSRALHGSAVIIVGHGMTQVIRFGSTLVLTRLLAPEVFGMMALVQLWMTGMEMLSDVGLRANVIRSKRGSDPEFLDTAWSIQILRGALLFVGGLLMAAPVAAFYGEPILAQLLPVTAASALLLGVRSTRIHTLSREMHVGKVVAIQIAARVSAIIVSVSLAWWFRSVWALVCGAVSAAFVECVISHLLLSGHRNRLRWERTAAKEIIHFGKWIFLSTVVTFLATRLDLIILGKLLSLEVLGVYNIALMFAMLPQEICGRLSDAVFIPALAEAYRQGMDRLRSAYRKAQRVLIPLALLIVASITLLAPPGIALLFPEKYVNAGQMVQFLMLTVWFFFLQRFANRVLLAIGDSRAVAFGNIVKLVFTAGCSVVGYQWGDLEGFLLGLGLGAFAGHVVAMIALGRHGIPCATYDMTRTAAGLLYVVPGAFLTAGQPWLPLPDREPITLAVAGVIWLLPVALWAGMRGRALWMERSSPS